MPILERQRHLLDFALSGLMRRRRRNGALFAVYTLIVFVLASLLFFVQALRSEADNLLSAAPDLVVQRLIAGRHDLIPLDYAEKIRTLRGVRSVTPRFWGYYYDPLSGANLTVMVPAADAPAAGEILLGSAAARLFRVEAGDLLPLRGADGQPLVFTVAALFSESADLVAADLVGLSAGDYRALFGQPADLATDLAVELGNPREAGVVAGKIVALFPESRPILRSEIAETYRSIFNWRGGMMLVVLIASILAFVIFAWDRAAGLSAEEKREIGILKGIGWETTDIFQLKAWEGFVISGSACLAGILFAYVHVFLFSAPLLAPALKGWSVLSPALRLTPAVDLYQFALLFVFAVVPYVVASIIPVWRTATIDPDAAMRS